MLVPPPASNKKKKSFSYPKNKMPFIKDIVDKYQMVPGISMKPHELGYILIHDFLDPHWSHVTLS